MGTNFPPLAILLSSCWLGAYCASPAFDTLLLLQRGQDEHLAKRPKAVDARHDEDMDVQMKARENELAALKAKEKETEKELTKLKKEKERAAMREQQKEEKRDRLALVGGSRGRQPVPRSVDEDWANGEMVPDSMPSSMHWSDEEEPDPGQHRHRAGLPSNVLPNSEDWLDKQYDAFTVHAHGNEEPHYVRHVTDETNSEDWMNENMGGREDFLHLSGRARAEGASAASVDEDWLDKTMNKPMPVDDKPFVARPGDAFVPAAEGGGVSLIRGATTAWGANQKTVETVGTQQLVQADRMHILHDLEKNEFNTDWEYADQQLRQFDQEAGIPFQPLRRAIGSRRKMKKPEEAYDNGFTPEHKTAAAAPEHKPDGELLSIDSTVKARIKDAKAVEEKQPHKKEKKALAPENSKKKKKKEKREKNEKVDGAIATLESVVEKAQAELNLARAAKAVTDEDIQKASAQADSEDETVSKKKATNNKQKKDASHAPSPLSFEAWSPASLNERAEKEVQKQTKTEAALIQTGAGREVGRVDARGRRAALTSLLASQRRLEESRGSVANAIALLEKRQGLGVWNVEEAEGEDDVAIVVMKEGADNQPIATGTTDQKVVRELSLETRRMSDVLLGRSRA